MNATPNYDERAIAVAQVVRDVIQPVDIFLFGSRRARGDWRDNSDIDIFTISESEADTKEKYLLGLQAGKAKALEIYGRPVKIDLVRYSPADFHRYRRARTHLTYAALRDGINMNHEPTNDGDRYPHTPPNNWPDVEQRFINYQRQVMAAEVTLEAGLGYEEVGQHFQRCLENALKGFLAYMGYDDGQGNTWLRTHDIGVFTAGSECFCRRPAKPCRQRLLLPDRVRHRCALRGSAGAAARRSRGTVCDQGNRGGDDGIHRKRRRGNFAPVHAAGPEGLTPRAGGPGMPGKDNPRGE